MFESIFFKDYDMYCLILIKEDEHQAYNFIRDGNFWYLEDAFDVENNFPTVGYCLDNEIKSNGWIFLDGYEYIKNYII